MATEIFTFGIGLFALMLFAGLMLLFAGLFKLTMVNQLFSVRLPRLSLYFWAALIAWAVLFVRTRKAGPDGRSAALNSN